MAVPTTGTLSMLGLAQEALYGTYGSGVITSPISIYDLVNGGNSEGSGNSYPLVNEDCLPNPATRNALTVTNVYTNFGSPFTLYYNSNIGVANQLAIDDFLFLNASLTSPASSADFDSDFLQNPGSASTQICSSSEVLAIFATDSTGKITSIGCDTP